MTYPKDIQTAARHLANLYVPAEVRDLFVEHAMILLMDERRKCYQMVLETAQPGERVPMFMYADAIRNMPDNVMFSEAAKAMRNDNDD